MIEYRLLGPLEVAVEGHAISIGGLRQRTLLAMLLLHANQPVPRDVLADQLWGEHPPPGAQHTLDVYVSRLRRALGAAGGTLVLTRPGAYLLRAEDEQVDVRRFEQLAGQARQALAANAPAEAAARFCQALALWRGAALADVGYESFAQAEIARLEDLRADTIEGRIDADLALGRHADVVGELRSLVAACPLRERRQEQLMVALYRCGRQPEALAAYQAARRAMVDELGIEPSPALQRVEHAILEQAAWLDPPSRAAPPAAPSPAARSPATRRWRLVAAAATTLAATLVFLLVGLPHGEGGSAPHIAWPNTVGVIDSRQNTLSGVVTGTGRPGGIAYAAHAIWITDTADNLLLRADSAHRVIDRIPVGRGPTGVTAGDGEIWVANELDGTVSEVNPGTGRVVGTIQVGNGPDPIAFGYGSVWAGNVTDNTLSRIDPGNGRVVAIIPLGSAPAGLAAGAHGMWVTSADTGRLLLVDPAHDRVSRAFPIGGSPVGVAVGADSVWVADSGGTVTQVDPVTGRWRVIRTGRAPAGATPAGLVYANGSVWAADSLSGNIARIDPGTRTVRLIRVGNEPTELAAAGRSILATVLPSLASHRGGTLTIVTQITAHDLPADTAVAWYGPLWQILSMTNDGLVGYRRVSGPAGDAPVPDLAAALPVPADGGRTYTFRLRRGIRYATGAVVRPEDFRRALERVFILNHGSGPALAFYSDIVGAGSCERVPRRCTLARGIVTNDRANTVTFHLTAPDPEFLDKLALPFADAVSAGVPDHAVSPVRLPATGPYLTQSLTAGKAWILVRNPRFRQWSDQAQPGGYPDRIVVRLDVAPGTAVSAVEHGHADLTLTPPPAGRIHELTTRYANLLHTGPVGATFGLFLNTRAWPFSVLAARRAVNYAVDRNRIIQLAGGPWAAHPACQILPPGMPGYQPYCPYTINASPAGAWTAPDLARAQQLVRASGTRGAKVTLLAGAFGASPPDPATGRYLVSVLRKIGYRASLRVLSPNTYYQRAGDSRYRTQIGEFTWYQDYPAPADFIDPLFTCRFFLPGNPGNINDSEFCDRRIDAQISRARALEARDLNSAANLWARIDRELVGQAPWVPLYNPRAVVVLSARVGNYQFNPYWTLLIDQLWVR